jgi:hypothetical protein
MNSRQRVLLALTLMACALVGCSDAGYSHVGEPESEAAAQSTPGRHVNGVDGPIVSTLDVLRASSAIVEGTVVDVSYSYNESAGPRTVARLDDLVVHAGSIDDKEGIVLETLGGPLPNGNYLHVPELARLTRGTRYLAYLHSREWFYSPVVLSHAYRLEYSDELKDDVLISQGGNVVVGIDPGEPQLSDQGVFIGTFDFIDPFRPRTLSDDANPLLARGVPKARYLETVLKLAEKHLSRAPFTRKPAYRENWATQHAVPDDGHMSRDEPTKTRELEGAQ